MHLYTYIIVWLALVFEINSASNADKKIVIVWGAAKHYYNFHSCIASTINYKFYNKPYCYRLIADVNKMDGVALETKCTMSACWRRQRLHTVLFVYFMVGAV